MDTLRIFLFGQLQVYRGDTCLSRFSTSKDSGLFCYLLLHRQRSHSRSLLAGLFWGESPEEQARKNLRTSLWRLRNLLEPAGQYPKGTYLAIDHDEISFNTRSNYWLDVEEFEKGLPLIRRRLPVDAELVDRQASAALSRVVELYRAELLEGCYEEWCQYERKRLQEMYLRALATLMAYHSLTQGYVEALRFGQRILSYDPLLEEVHRELMRLYWLTGNRAAAVRQFHQCQAILAKDMGVEPMKETVGLYKEILRDRTAIGEENSNLRLVERIGRRSEPTSRAQGANPALRSRTDEMACKLRQALAEAHQLSAHLQSLVEDLEAVRHESARS